MDRTRTKTKEERKNKEELEKGSCEKHPTQRAQVKIKAREEHKRTEVDQESTCSE